MEAVSVAVFIRLTIQRSIGKFDSDGGFDDPQVCDVE
jgi:hypothetical protein